MNATTFCSQQVAVRHAYGAHMHYMQFTQFRLLKGKLMTPNSCITLAVCRLHLACLSQCNSCLPCLCLSLLQPVFANPESPAWDRAMGKSRKVLMGHQAKQRMMGARQQPVDDVQVRRSTTRTLLVITSTGCRGIKSLNAAGRHSAPPRPT